METEIEIDGKMFPANLKVCFDTNSQKDYEIKDVYYLLMSEKEIAGSFTAIIRYVNQKRIVLTTDESLLKKVLYTLLLRDTKIIKKQFLVHRECPIGYSLDFKGNGTQSTLYRLLDEDEFKILINKDKEFNPFKWSSDDMSKNPLFGLKVAVENV